jgi:hypothetical protein
MYLMDCSRVQPFACRPLSITRRMARSISSDSLPVPLVRIGEQAELLADGFRIQRPAFRYDTYPLKRRKRGRSVSSCWIEIWK